MKFTSAHLVETTLWQMRQADLPRGTNRAHIERLFNGLPPWTEEDAQQQHVDTNVNFLEAPKLAADARRTYYNAFLKPGLFFNVTLDYGNKTKRKAWAEKITRELNKKMKRSLKYFEFLRSQFASTVLHGIGAGFWCDADRWCPEPIGVEDVMIPSSTLLTMDNLSHFGVFRKYTPMQMYKMTKGAKVDPAWNMNIVDAALDWVEGQTAGNYSYSDHYSPQKREERWKQDLGYYGTDSVPTIDCWDFYFWSDEDDHAGWRRRMVLDTPAIHEVDGRAIMPENTKIGSKHGEWLYCPDDNRVYADNYTNILHFQFGDASAVAPFRYHSVRSLGWLLYAICHLSNRFQCKINDHAFESLLQYFRTSNPDDKERIMKVDLQHLGVVPEGLAFVTQQERWQTNQQYIELILKQNRDKMNESAAQYREGRDTNERTEKTATQIMAEVNAANALVGSMLLQAYQYQAFQYEEIARRFCKKNSSDPDVKSFRACILGAGIPEEVLDCSTWNIEPERVLGSGNKILEVAMADKLMAARPLHDPESQREILYIYDLANSDADTANRLVPLDQPRVSDTVHDVQLAVGTLMQGVLVPPKKSHNPIEAIETLMASAATIIQTIQASGIEAGDVIGFSTVIQAIARYIQMLEQDPAEKQRVKVYLAQVSNLLKLLKQFEAQAQQNSQQQQPQAGVDPKDAQKIQGMALQAQTKAQLTKESHAQRTQQRDVQFRMKLQQDQEKHEAELAKKVREESVNQSSIDIKTAAEIRRDGAKAASEASQPEPTPTSE